MQTRERFKSYMCQVPFPRPNPEMTLSKNSSKLGRQGVEFGTDEIAERLTIEEIGPNEIDLVHLDIVQEILIRFLRFMTNMETVRIR